MTEQITDFTADELDALSQTLLKRYRQEVPVEVAIAEIQLDQEDLDVTECPVICWEGRGAHFVLFKLGANRYRGQFYYSDAQQYGTGLSDFGTISDCAMTLLRAQADHERQSSSMRSGLAMTDRFDQQEDGPLLI